MDVLQPLVTARETLQNFRKIENLHEIQIPEISKPLTRKAHQTIIGPVF